MESTFVIYIGIYKLLGLVGTLILGTWYLSHRLTKVETKVEGFDTRLTNFEGRLDNAFANASPISLQPAGLKALKESGLEKWIDDNNQRLLAECKSKSAMSNQYDMQEAAFKLFDQIDLGDFEPNLKQAAFNYGWSIETMRRIGGIYFRDLCLKEHGFTPDDLDKPKGV